MRTFFLLLVAANLALLAWSRLGPPLESPAADESLRRQIAPEKIRVLDAKDLAGLPTPPKPRPVVETTPKACLEWGGFAVAEAPRGEEALKGLALAADRIAQNRTEETAGWWVFISPQGNRAGALKKAAELKNLGVGEFFILPEEGKMQWAISLGVFSSEEAAKKQLDALKAKGVKSAQTGERETRVTKVWFQVRNPELPLQAKLRDLAQAFPGTELRDCQ